MSCSSSRKGKGRQKVEMVKIGNETNLQVTFSKRRAGLFKKASELSTLCGAETAVVVFSPGNKAHCFGHPNVDAVANKFLDKDVAPMSDADKLVEAHQKANINQQNLELTQIQNQLEFEQKRGRELERESKDAQLRRQRPDIDKLNYRQLDRLKGALLRLRHQLQTKVDNATDHTNCLPPGPVPNPGIDLREINPNHVQVLDGATIPYDPTEVGDSCPIIPYSSTAATSSIDPNNEH